MKVRICQGMSEDSKRRFYIIIVVENKHILLLD